MTAQERVTRAFREIDASRKGLISRAECKAVFRDVLPDWAEDDLSDLFQAANVGQDEMLLYEELVDWLFSPKMDGADEEARQQYFKIATAAQRKSIATHQDAQPWAAKTWTQRLKIAEILLPEIISEHEEAQSEFYFCNAIDPRARQRVEQLFEVLDRDSNGTLDRGELTRFLQPLIPNFDENDLNTLMDFADLNQNGVLDYDEVYNWIESERQGGSHLSFNATIFMGLEIHLGIRNPLIRNFYSGEMVTHEGNAFPVSMYCVFKEDESVFYLSSHRTDAPDIPCDVPDIACLKIPSLQSHEELAQPSVTYKVECLFDRHPSLWEGILDPASGTLNIKGRKKETDNEVRFALKPAKTASLNWFDIGSNLVGRAYLNGKEAFPAALNFLRMDETANCFWADLILDGRTRQVQISETLKQLIVTGVDDTFRPETRFSTKIDKAGHFWIMCANLYSDGTHSQTRSRMFIELEKDIGSIAT